MKKRAKIVLLVIAVVVIGGIVFLKQNKALEVDTIKIEKQDMIRNFKETATLESQNVLAVSAPYSDEILFVAEQGSVVNKGDLLLTLDTKNLMTKKNELLAKKDALYGQEKMTSPELHNSQLQSLDIAINMARDVANRTKVDADKNYTLYQQGAISEEQYNRYLRAYQDANKALSLKQSERQVLLDNTREKAGSSQFYNGQRQSVSEILADIESKLSQQNIYAESSAVVTDVYAIKGDMTNPMQPLLKLASKDDMLAVCDIIASDAMALSVGQTVKIIVKIGQESQEFMGEIAEIANNANSKVSALGLDEQRVTVKVKSDQFKDLIIGCDMDIIFETMHLENKLIAPKTAVFKKEGKDYVWLIEAGKLNQKQIEIGKDSDYDYEVLSGLKEGDTIVLNCNNSDLQVGKKVESNK